MDVAGLVGGQNTPAFELCDFAKPLAIQGVIVGREHQHALINASKIGFDTVLLEMREDGIGQAKGNKGFPHADFIGEDLDFEPLGRARMKEAFQEHVHRALLPGNVIGVFHAILVAAKIEMVGAGDHDAVKDRPSSTALW
jgi:hypothetical protein